MSRLLGTLSKELPGHLGQGSSAAGAGLGGAGCGTELEQ